ncbi:hypothetical protein AC630_39290 [Bradyrhizobium sp. AS23.2]|nr:hypothetical protein AC630_39290 [Bradyrhizobium sp. AS23.2]
MDSHMKTTLDIDDTEQPTSSNDPSTVLSFDETDAIIRDVPAEAQARRKQAARDNVQPLRRASCSSPMPRRHCYARR